MKNNSLLIRNLDPVGQLPYAWSAIRVVLGDKFLKKQLITSSRGGSLVDKWEEQ